MQYNWDGMRKLTWEDVKDRIVNGGIIGCYMLYQDGTEALIEMNYDVDDLVKHHNNGEEFGEHCYKNTEEYEYCAFVWNILEEKMVPYGRVTRGRFLCEHRLAEKIESKIWPDFLDRNKWSICKRKVVTQYGKWEVLE